MKLATAVMIAGTIAGTAVTCVGAAHIIQQARQQKERNEAVLVQNQIEWLTQVTTHRDLARDLDA